MPQPHAPTQATKPSRRSNFPLLKFCLWLGLMTVVWSVSCGETSPEQRTREVIDSAREKYEEQVDAIKDLQPFERREVETPLRLTVVNMSGPSCGLRPDNEVVCWGDESNWKGFTGKFTAISGGFIHICGLRENQTIECAGSNTSFGEEVGQARPPAGEFKDLSAGAFHNCAISLDDSLVCWGRNDSGQSTAPDGKYRTVAAGLHHTCAISMNDSVECWGKSREGFLLSPSGEFVQIDADSFHTCGLRRDDSIVCWGDNEDGATSAPGGEFSSVSVGGGFSCGIHKNDALNCWGINTGGDEFNEAPSGKFGTVSLSAGNSCGIKTDGNLLCWGNMGEESVPPFEAETSRQIATAATPTPSSTVAPTPTLIPPTAAVSAAVALPAATVATATSPAPTSTPIATATPEPTSTLIATAAPASTSTPAATAAPAPTSTPVATATPAPTSTPVATATPAPTSTPVATATPAPTSTPVATATPAPTSTPAPRPDRELLLRELASVWGKAFPQGDWATVHAIFSSEFQNKCPMPEYAEFMDYIVENDPNAIPSGATYILEDVVIEGNFAWVHSHFVKDDRIIYHDEDQRLANEPAEWEWTGQRWDEVLSPEFLSEERPCDLDSYRGLELSLPYKSGSTMRGSDGTEIKVVGINEDAWEVVRRENQFNDPPTAGNRYYIVRVEVENVAGAGAVTVTSGDIELIGSNRLVYQTYRHYCGVIPDELFGTIYPGGKVEGNACFQVGANETGFVLIHNPAFSGDVRFLALE